MFSTIKYKKIANALAAAGFIFASTSYASDKESQHSIKIKQIQDDVKVMVSEGHNSDVRVIKLDKADLGRDALEEKLDDLPDDMREKIESLLEQIDIQGNEVTILSDKLVQTFGEDGTFHKTIILQQDSEDFTLHLPPEPPLPPGAPKPAKPTNGLKVFKFSFDGDGKGEYEFKLLSALLKESNLSVEQLDELQTLLNEKY